MTVTVRLFAVLRENAGTGMLTLDLPSGSRVEDAVRAVVDQCPSLEKFVAVIRTAVNEGWATLDTGLHDGDELALLFPVSGG